MNISNKKQIQLKEIIIHVENMHVDKDFFVNSQKNIFLYDIVRWKISDPNIIKTKQMISLDEIINAYESIYYVPKNSIAIITNIKGEIRWKSICKEDTLIIAPSRMSNGLWAHDDLNINVETIRVDENSGFVLLEYVDFLIDMIKHDNLNTFNGIGVSSLLNCKISFSCPSIAKQIKIVEMYEELKIGIDTINGELFDLEKSMERYIWKKTRSERSDQKKNLHILSEYCDIKQIMGSLEKSEQDVYKIIKKRTPKKNNLYSLTENDAAKLGKEFKINKIDRISILVNAQTFKVSILEEGYYFCPTRSRMSYIVTVNSDDESVFACCLIGIITKCNNMKYGERVTQSDLDNLEFYFSEKLCKDNKLKQLIDRYIACAKWLGNFSTMDDIIMDRYEYNKEDITEGEIQAWILSNTEGLEINPYSEENRKRFIANEKALCDIKMLEVNK